jgi:hypothetical protein
MTERYELTGDKPLAAAAHYPEPVEIDSAAAE